jgi:septal ring factor EnvC (AmiA/AmiB activator)
VGLAWDQATFNALMATIGVAGAVISLLATLAAFRSASSAAKTIEQAVQLERKNLERELAQVANKVCALTIRVDDLGDRLKSAYHNLLTLSNQSVNKEPFTNAIDQKKKSAGEMQKTAYTLLQSHADWSKQSSDELSAKLIVMDGYFVHLDRVREKFNRELDCIEADSRIYRERQLQNSMAR